jgi:exosortase/archaeosortase family protein
VRISWDWRLLVGSMLIIGALYNHYMGHSVLVFEIILLAVGSAIGILSIGPALRSRTGPIEHGMLTRFLMRFAPERLVVVAIPLFGLLLLISWSAWKVLSVGETNLRMEDIVVTLFALSLVLYQSGPSRFYDQKDFAVLFLLFLTMVFAVMWKVYTMVTGESYGRVTAYSEYYFITIPVVEIVNLLGVDATAVLNLSGFGLSNMIEYFYEGRLVRLGIGTGCSGLYSAGLFFSAFLAFVLVRYKTLNARILAGLGLGLLVTWFSNIIRMVVTVMVGAVWGPVALATFHMYFGILLFVAVVLVFWLVVAGWLDRHIPVPSPEGETAAAPVAAETVHDAPEETIIEQTDEEQ